MCPNGTSYFCLHHIILLSYLFFMSKVKIENKKINLFQTLNFLVLVSFSNKEISFSKIILLVENLYLPLHCKREETTFASEVESLAQLAEHIPFKDGVLGSNPRRLTKGRLIFETCDKA